MDTFVFILAIAIAAPGAPVDVQTSIVDHSLSLADCLGLWIDYQPSAVELRNGVAIYTDAACELDAVSAMRADRAALAAAIEAAK